MFERYTERARQVIVMAREEAQRLNHSYITTEHLLLGLLREEEGIAAQVLESLDITDERVRAHIVRMSVTRKKTTSGQIPFTSGAEKVLVQALRVAMHLGSNYVATEHILLSLIQEDEDTAVQLLRSFELTTEKIRDEVLRMLKGDKETPAVTTFYVWTDGTQPVLLKAEDAEEAVWFMARSQPVASVYVVPASAVETYSVDVSVTRKERA